MTASINRTQTGATKILERMANAPNFLPGYLNTVVMRQYQISQEERFRKENVGQDFEGGQWAPLNPVYANWKAARYGSRKILVRTGHLYDSVMNPYKVIDGNRLRLTVRPTTYTDEVTKRKENTSSYAGYADGPRTFSSWSRLFYSKLQKGFVKYLKEAR